MRKIPFLLMSFTSKPPTPKFKDIPKSMQEIPLRPADTPYPLPVYDASMRFGPTRVENSTIPDVLDAQARLRKEGTGVNSRHAQTKVMEHFFGDDPTASSELQEVAEEEQNQRLVASQPLTAASTRIDWRKPKYLVEDVGGSPQIDRLICVQPPSQLLQQLKRSWKRPESLCAALSDISSTIHSWSNDELRAALEVMEQNLEPGKPLCFFLRPTLNKGWLYMRPDESLLASFLGFVESLEEEIINSEEGRVRLLEDPQLAADILAFLSHIQIFDRESWFTFHPSVVSGRTARGNPRSSVRAPSDSYGYELLEFVFDCLRTREFREKLTGESTATILSALSGLDKEGRVQGDIAQLLVDFFMEQATATTTAVKGQQESFRRDDVVCQFWYACVSAGIIREDVQQLAAKVEVPTPEWFIAASRSAPFDAKTSLHQMEKVLRLCESAVRTAEEKLKNTTASMEERKTLQKEYKKTHGTLIAYWKACLEMIMKLPIEDANRILMERNTDATLLQSAPYFRKALIENPAPHFWNDYLPQIRTWSNAFILHSSSVEQDCLGLIAMLNETDSGQCGMVVLTSTLLELTRILSTTTKKSKRRSARRALKIIASAVAANHPYLVIVPFSEELQERQITDGQAQEYTDEDISVWNITKALLKKSPATVPSPAFSRQTRARSPHIFLNKKLATKDLETVNHLVDTKIGSPHNLSRRVRNASGILSRARLKDMPVQFAAGQISLNSHKQRAMYLQRKNMFEKVRTGQNDTVLPGHSRSAVLHDFRNLGVYTPDFPQ